MGGEVHAVVWLCEDCVQEDRLPLETGWEGRECAFLECSAVLTKDNAVAVDRSMMRMARMD